MPQPRTHLPIPSAARTGLITYDAKDPDSTYPPIEQLRPPAGAPNVLLILLDDVGFGASSAFGGPCRTSTAELLAGNGLRYNRFHTTALCSPTRQALLTGRNHHSAGMGGITEIATGATGYSSVLPNTMSPIARTLKLNGYNTAQFGKCHEVPVWQTSPVGPFDAWPSGGGGFEYFYGFIGGEASSRPTTAAMSAWIRARPSHPTMPRGVTRSTGGSRACSSRSPRPPLLRAIWSTRSTRSASRWRANRAAQSNGEGTAMEKSRCHAVAHGGGCAGSAKSHKSGGRCGQGRGAGDSHGTRGAGRRYRAASAPHPLAVGAHLRDELAKRSADPRLTDELNDLAGHTLDDL